MTRNDPLVQDVKERIDNALATETQMISYSAIQLQDQARRRYVRLELCLIPERVPASHMTVSKREDIIFLAALEGLSSRRKKISAYASSIKPSWRTWSI